jgi:hypothetical protein
MVITVRSAVNPPSLYKTLLSLFLSGVIVDSAVGADGSEIDYKPLYKNANRSAALWKKEAQHREVEILQLREMLGQTPRAARTPASQPANEAEYEEFYVEIPDNGASTIGYYGGPDIKVNIWWKLQRGAILQVGADSLHKVILPASGRALIYRDAESGNEVYLTDRIASKEKLQLLVRRPKY